MGQLYIKMDVESLSKRQKEIRRRIIEVSYELKFSHLGSCLSAVDIIDCIYQIKKKNDKFILSNGHAGMALYAILEKNKFIKNLQIIKQLNVHPDRNPKIGIHTSTGSLGHGLPIALGMALANPKKTIYCMISDGECAEGSIWEALRIAVDKKIHNLKIIVNANGWGAYDPIDTKILKQRLGAFGYHLIKINGHDQNSIKKALLVKPRNKPILIFAKTTIEQFPFLKGQDAHYHVMNEQEYSLATGILQ